MFIAFIQQFDTEDESQAMGWAQETLNFANEAGGKLQILGLVANDGQSWVGSSVDDPETEIAALEERIAELREQVA